MGGVVQTCFQKGGPRPPRPGPAGPSPKSAYEDFQSSFNFCPPFCLSELKVGAVNHFDFTVLHSISLFCTDLGLIDMLLTNQNAETVACIFLVENITPSKTTWS